MLLGDGLPTVIIDLKVQRVAGARVESADLEACAGPAIERSLYLLGVSEKPFVVRLILAVIRYDLCDLLDSVVGDAVVGDCFAGQLCYSFCVADTLNIILGT